MRGTDNFPIGIIGGTGGMGRWFADFFEKEGHPVLVSGRDRGARPAEMAGTCPVVIVSVPIRSTTEVIRQTGPHMKRDSLLMDLTSLKAEPVRAMLESSVSEVIGLHPLFGPSVPSIEDQNIVICPARSGKWLPWVRDVFGRKGAKLVEATPERHDEIMAVVQALNHLDTIVMGLVIRQSGLEREIRESFSTPILRGKLGMIDRVFSNPRLHTELITANPNTAKALRLYRDILDKVGEAALKGNADGLAAALRRPAPG